MSKSALKEIQSSGQHESLWPSRPSGPMPSLIETVKFSPDDLRAARGLLNWSRKDLRALSGVSMETIKNIEMGVWKPNESNYMKLVTIFAKHGVEFVCHNGFARYGLKVSGVMRVKPEQELPIPKE